MATRIELRNQIRRNLGHPFVKVELCDDHLDDAINDARDLWIKWTIGNSSQDRWILVLLRGGYWLYDLPQGVIEVLNYRDEFGYGGSSTGSHHTYETGGAQTLFSFDNAMYMNGVGNLNYGGHGGYNMVSWQIANQAMGDIEHYHVNRFNWYYHKSTNQLELQPTPDCLNTLSVTTDLSGNMIYDPMENPVACSLTTETSATTATEILSPGWILLHVQMIEGSPLPTYTPPTSADNINSIFNISDNYSEWLFNEEWIVEYATAKAMIVLGRIRRKFASYGSMGGQGIALDGDALVSEGTEMKNQLEEELDTKHAYEGMGIILG